MEKYKKKKVKMSQYQKLRDNFFNRHKHLKRVLIYFGEEPLMYNEWYVFATPSAIKKLKSCNDFLEAQEYLGQTVDVEDNSKFVDDFIDLSEIAKPFLDNPIKWYQDNIMRLPK